MNHMFENAEFNSFERNYLLKASDRYPFIGELQNGLNDNVKSLKIWADPLTEQDQVRKDLDDTYCEVTVYKEKWFRNGEYFQNPGSSSLDIFDLDNHETRDDTTDALYLRGNGCKIKLFEKHGFNNDGDVSEVHVAAGQNEAYIDLQRDMVYNGSSYSGEVDANKLGSFKMFK